MDQRRLDAIQSWAAGLSVVFSICALIIAYLSYDLSKTSDARMQENISFSRANCCVSGIEVETSADGTISLARDVGILISNNSQVPTTITHCFEYAAGGRWLGSSGSNCDGKIEAAGGEVIDLPYLIQPGAVLLLTDRETLDLAPEDAAHFQDFQASPDFRGGEGDFVTYLCERGLALERIASLQPYDSCIQTHNVTDRIRSWITLHTGRGGVFESDDLSQF